MPTLSRKFSSHSPNFLSPNSFDNFQVAVGYARASLEDSMNSRSHPVSQTSLFITSSLVVFIVTTEFFLPLGEEVRLPSPNTISGQSSILAASLPGAPLSSFFHSAGSVAELLTLFRSYYCSSVPQLLTCFSQASALFCLLI